jgi:integrase/recombinase XerD
MTALAPTLQAFFTQRLISQRQASPNTVAAYRDAWRLLLRHAQDRTGKQPCQLDLERRSSSGVGFRRVAG